MITYDQAFSADEFHIAHAGLPCTVWHRAGITHNMNSDDTPIGGFFLPVFRNNNEPGSLRRNSETDYHHITGVNAGDFHVADECPHLRTGDDRPPVSSDQSEGQPTLSTGDGEDGYDALGYDADGYDRNGYDAEGYDAEGYDAEGYDATGYDADGDPRPGSMDAGDLDLAELWSAFHVSGSARWNTHSRQSDFRDHLRSLVADPGEIDELEFCGNCDDPAWDDDLRGAMGGGLQICDSCWDDWTYCDRCEERYSPNDMTEALSGSDICESCRSSYYSWCDDCDGWYPDEYSDDHEHSSGGDGCCTSPQPAFRIRNDSCEPLANDTKITVTLPAGTISAEGLAEIKYYLQREGQFDLSYSVDAIGAQWQTREGNFAKRLSRHAYQAHQAKLTPDVLSQVGCIARDHSTAVDVRIEVSRDLNTSAADWYHEDSCWWGSYGESRCTLKTNGGFGIRSFSSPDHHSPSGRAWVMPLRLSEDGRLKATFATMTADAFVVFNGYGDLSGYAAPRILAHMAGWTYRKIDFKASPMYVNAGGYLVAPEEIAAQYTDGSVHLSVSQHSHLFERESVNA